MKKLKHFFTSEGPTSTRYQQRADKVTNVMGWIGIVMAVVGAVVVFFIMQHAWTAVSKPIEGLSILHR